MFILCPLFTFVLITATVEVSYKICNNVEMFRSQEAMVTWCVPMCTHFTITYLLSNRPLVTDCPFREIEGPSAQLVNRLGSFPHTFRHSASGKHEHHWLLALACITDVLYNLK